MTAEALIAAGAGWWLVWALRPALVPALDRFWKRVFRDITF